MPESRRVGPGERPGFLGWLLGKGGMKRTVLVPFLVLIAASFGLGWVFYVQGSRQALLGAVDSHVRESAIHARDQVASYLDQAVELAQVNATYLALIEDPARVGLLVRKSFRSQLLGRGDISIISVGFEDGLYLEAQRLEDGRIRTGTAGAATGGALVLEEVDAEGEPVAVAFRREGYDPRTRPWYRSAAEDGSPRWTAPYPILSTGELTMAAVVPVMSGGRRRGVVTADLHLGKLSAFLSGIEAVGGGFALIIDGEDRVVAASASVPRGEGPGPAPAVVAAPLEPLTPVSLLDPRVSTLLAGARAEPGRVLPLRAGGGRYRAVLLGQGDSGGLFWRILVAFPESAFAAPLRGIDARIGVLFLMTLGLSILLAFFAAHRIAEPLRRLGLALAEAGPGPGAGAAGADPGPGAPAGDGGALPGLAIAEARELSGRRDEIGKLASSFVAMTLRLDASFTELRASLAEKEVLLKEVHHRVKNNLQIVSSLLNFQSGSSGDEAVRESLERLQERIQAMAYVHEDVYESGSFGSVGMQRYFERVCDSLCSGSLALVGRAGRPASCAVEIAVRAEGVELPLDRAIPCGLIVNELVANALKHAFRGRDCGRVEVLLARDGSAYRLEVADDGPGVEAMAAGSPAPRRTDGGEGLGASLVAGLAAQLRGSVAYESGPGGTRVRVGFAG